MFRIYNRDHTTENPPRPNRISFYVFNPDGRLGVGSYFQDTLQEGTWMFVVGVANTTRTYIYRDGRYRRCDTYRGPADDQCPIHFLPPPNDDVQLKSILPRAHRLCALGRGIAKVSFWGASRE